MTDRELDNWLAERLEPEPIEADSPGPCWPKDSKKGFWLLFRFHKRLGFVKEATEISKNWEGAGRVLGAMRERAGNAESKLWSRFLGDLNDLAGDDYTLRVFWILSPKMIALAAKAALEAEES
jgi:hypothetical protein